VATNVSARTAGVVKNLRLHSRLGVRSPGGEGMERRGGVEMGGRRGRYMVRKIVT